MSNKNEFNQTVGFAVKNWQPALRPTKNILQGQYCTLELFDISKHAAKLFSALQINNLGESWTYLPYGPFENENEFSAWLQKAMQDPTVVFYAILDNKKNPIGICSYLAINPEHGSIEVGHLHFSKLLQRTPAATEAMFLMMQYAFEELNYRRYEWKCNSLNEPSIKAALRLGFKFEGTFRQHNVFKGCNRDTNWYSIIDSEWPALKENFMRWLKPSNFDRDGHQKTNLNGKA